MKTILKRGATSNILRVFLQDSTSTTGAGKTGLTNTSTGLIISTIADNEATATTYTAAASNTETITTLGTFAAPSSGKARFKEVDSTNFPGLYEVQIADARFAVANSTQLLVSVQASGAAPTFAEVQLVTVDLYDTVRFGLTALPNVASGSAGAIITSGTGTAQLSVASGAVTVGTNNDKTGYSLSTAPPTASAIADSVWGSSLTANSGSTAWANDTFGKSVLRAYNNTNAFIKTAGTGAGHVGADVHAMQDDVITAASIATNAIGADALAADAVTEIWDKDISGYTTAGLAGTYLKNATSDWTADQRTAIRSALGIPATGTTLVAPAIELAKTTNITGFNDLSAAQVNTEADTALADVGLTTTVTGRIDAAISTRSTLTAANVWDTDISGYSNAAYAGTYLKNATADWTANEKTAIRAILGVPASGTTPTDPTSGILDTIRDKAFDIETDTQDIQGRLPTSLVSGRIDASVGAMANDVITNSALAATAATEIANSVWDSTKSTWSDAGKSATLGYQLAVGIVPVTPPDAETIAAEILGSTVEAGTGNTLSNTLGNLRTTLEAVPGSSNTNWRFDSASLTEAPTGSSDWTSNERTAIRAVLGVTADTAAPGTPSTGILSNISGRIPTALVSGRMDSYVGEIATGAITAASIASAAITSAKFASAAITGTVIQDGAITAGKIATGAITSGKFAAGAIDANAIAANAITVSEIADGAITSAKFGAGAIDATAFNADAVTKIWQNNISAFSTAGQAGTYLKNSGTTAPTDVADAILNRKLDSSGSIFDITCQAFQGQSSFSGSNTFTAGDRVRFLSTAPSGFSTNQDYYIHPDGLTSSTFQLRSSPSSGNPILAQESNSFTLIPAEDRTVRSALRYLRNRVNIPANTDTMTIYREDDVQRAWSSTVVGSADALPIVDSNPTGGS